jgi:threonine dehydratase
VVVPLDAAAQALRLAAERCHVVMEGAAACAVAAARMPALAGHKKIVAVVSGGNIDLKKFAELTLNT